MASIETNNSNSASYSRSHPNAQGVLTKNNTSSQSSAEKVYGNTPDNQDSARGRADFSFYFKLLLLYFLNIIDWFCTEALLKSGRFFEANPLMQPVLDDFWMTLLIKGGLPLILIGICAIVYKIADCEVGFGVNILLYIGIFAYSLLNLWHIFNFVLLFLSF